MNLSFGGIYWRFEDFLSQTRREFRTTEYTQENLLEELAAGWVPFIECHKCGWFAHCPYPERIPGAPHRARDIQCGVVRLAMRNFLSSWWSALSQMTQDQKQHFIDAFFWWTKYVGDAVLSLGRICDVDHLAWCGPELSALTMTEPKRHRRALDKFSYHISLTGHNILEETFALVEGESEAAFLEVLVDLRFFGSGVLGVETYRGKGNAKPGRLPIAHLFNRGVRPMLQIDGDKSSRPSPELEVLLGANDGAIFRFSRDFESAFPALVLQFALAELDHQVGIEWLQERLSDEHGSIFRSIEQKLGITISKPEFARELAYLVGRHWSEVRQTFPNAEVVRWLDDIQAKSLRRKGNTNASGVA
jgi:hypothetical protein